jgi:hypothetical protein
MHTDRSLLPHIISDFSGFPACGVYLGAVSNCGFAYGITRQIAYTRIRNECSQLLLLICGNFLFFGQKKCVQCIFLAMFNQCRYGVTPIRVRYWQGAPSVERRVGQ